MSKERKSLLLRDSVQQSLTEYFAHLEGSQPERLYDLVIQEVERPLLEITLQQVQNNQSLAATILGISRGTLRKKIKKYKI